jgi:V/A-type H+-transporting ATPase subunit E
MSLETVVEDIREQAREEAEQIRQEADEEAQAIIEEAEADAEEIRAERAREAEREAKRERDQTLSSAKLEAKQQRLEARRRTLSEVRDSVEQELAELEEGREELTAALLADAAAEFDETPVRVYGRPDDEALVSGLLEDEAYEGFEWAGERDCLGGVIVESDASRVRVNNTFDSLLEDVWDDSLGEVSDVLFGERDG